MGVARVHHLNCATLCPPAARLVNETGHLVCHCLLVETARSLVLVDTGLGTADLADPARLGVLFRWVTRPRLDPVEPARAQIERRGFAPADVTDIVVTHLDLDHAGGLGDFPHARVHVHRSELEAARHPSRRERGRYRPAQWRHGPKWKTYGPDGDEWFGFASVREIDGPGGVLLVPLAGHSRGHAAVALQVEGRWLLHCGDAYFDHHEIDPERPSCPPGLRLFQRVVEFDRDARLENQARLRKLRAAHEREVELFCAHDPAELRRYAEPGSAPQP